MKGLYEPKGRAREYAALAVNVYTGCTNGCTYCYVPAMMRKTAPAFHRTSTARSGIAEAVRKDCRRLSGTEQPAVLLSFTSDPYPEDSEPTREVIQALVESGFAVEVLTKGGKRCLRDLDLLRERGSVATTLTHIDEETARKYEPHAASPEERIEALKEAHAQGVRTWVSLEPVLNPDVSLWLIDLTHEFVNFYKVGILNHQKNATDWKTFGEQAETKLNHYGKPHIIKDDLLRHMGRPTNGQVTGQLYPIQAPAGG